MAGASWIWPGDVAHGVSPVYLRRKFVPTAIAAAEAGARDGRRHRR
jgi:hypothetical protein